MDSFDRLLQEIAQRHPAPTVNSGNLPTEPPAPDCPICGDLGFVTHDVPVGHPDFGKAFPCRCQTEKRHAQHEQRIRNLSALGAFSDKTFENFNPTRADLTPEQNANLRSAYEIAARFAESPEGWLLFSGPYGSGKTHLAAAIANFRVSGYEEEALLVTVPDLLDHLRATYAPSSEVAYDDLFER